MSQAVFARSFQLSLDTVKGWEQGKRKPDAAAANYLRMIKADPKYVQRTLAA
jgi:putative transcriptional regulator